PRPLCRWSPRWCGTGPDRCGPASIQGAWARAPAAGSAPGRCGGPPPARARKRCPPTCALPPTRWCPRAPAPACRFPWAWTHAGGRRCDPAPHTRSRLYEATNGLAESPTGRAPGRSSRSGGLLGLSVRWTRRPLPLCSTWNNQLQQAPDILLVVKLNDDAPALALRLYLHFRP